MKGRTDNEHDHEQHQQAAECAHVFFVTTGLREVKARRDLHRDREIDREGRPGAGSRAVGPHDTPCASTMYLTIASPRPNPPSRFGNANRTATRVRRRSQKRRPGRPG